MRAPAFWGLIGIFILSPVAPAERPGGEIRSRIDGKGLEYFEVFADATHGNHASPAPMHLVGDRPQLPKSLHIRAESTWKVGKSGRPADASGSSGGNCPHCPEPSLPPGALIARWVTLDVTMPPNPLATSLPTEPLSAWFLIGTSISVDVPVQKAAPRPFTPTWLNLYRGLNASPELHYTPLIGLQYQCNAAEFSNNDGWLHVYQEWIW